MIVGDTMFVHDVIKIRYSNDGYLIDYPYHMISDKEMMQAFYDANGAGFFTDNYPCMSDDIEFIRSYNILVQTILTYITLYINEEIATIPDWIYSYMLGATISVNSDKLDIYDLSVQLGVGKTDIFTQACSEACFNESSVTCKGYRRHTLNINSFSAKTVDALKNIKLVYNTDTVPNLYAEGVEVITLYDLYRNVTISSSYERPPTMFGEPHIIKSLRLRQISL